MWHAHGLDDVKKKMEKKMLKKVLKSIFDFCSLAFFFSLSAVLDFLTTFMFVCFLHPHLSDVIELCSDR